MDPSTYTDPELTYQDRLVIDAIVEPQSSSNGNRPCIVDQINKLTKIQIKQVHSHWTS